MSNRKLYAASITALLPILFITACDVGTIAGETKSFASELRGTWVSHDDSKYKGSLKIEYDRITITGFIESQTPSGGDDSNRPFKGFTKETPLKGYSEEGKIFIEDRGSPQEGIPYNLYPNGAEPPVYFLEFKFGGRPEIMKKQ
jgi:hypothetical protein